MFALALQPVLLELAASRAEGGLELAFAYLDDVCLAGDAVAVVLSELGAGRRARITGPADFMARLDRSLAIRGFLDRSGYRGATRAYLVGDASARAYETISLGQAAP